MSTPIYDQLNNGFAELYEQYQAELTNPLTAPTVEVTNAEPGSDD